MTSELVREAEAILPEVIELRRAIHAEPELGLDNPKTQQKILEALSGFGLDSVRTGEGLTSVVAELEGGRPGPTVLLRADTDALPMTEDTDEPFRSTVEGAAHACGHDSHVAMLVGAARMLAERRADLAGTVRFMFQPGEEGGGGAEIMVAEGVTDGVDRSFAIHITPNIPARMVSTRPGPIMASTDELHVTVVGKGGHASTPHFCIDPIPAAAAMISALQTMLTRELDAFNPAVLTIARLQAGTTTNVIPETAVMDGTIRAVNEMTRMKVHESSRRVIAGIAAAHGCTADVQIEPGYPVTVNHEGESARAARLAGELVGVDHYFELPTPVMGAEDYSYVTQKVPGAMALLGVCPDDIDDSLSAPACHSNRMRLNESALPVGVALHVAMAMDGA